MVGANKGGEIINERDRQNVNEAPFRLIQGGCTRSRRALESACVISSKGACLTAKTTQVITRSRLIHPGNTEWG